MPAPPAHPKTVVFPDSSSSSVPSRKRRFQPNHSKVAGKDKQPSTQHKNNSYTLIPAAQLRHDRESLPIYSAKTDLRLVLSSCSTAIVVADTGSGKSTQVTQYMREWGYARRRTKDDKSPPYKHFLIACTQPRRVAAISVAGRVAAESACELGGLVGYSIRFDDNTQRDTQIKYITDGMLLRETLHDNLLLDYSVICLDEAHSRSVNTDILFALLKKIQAKRQNILDEHNKSKEGGGNADLSCVYRGRELIPLKLIIMSATLESRLFSEYFHGCPVFTVKGRQYPVTLMYTRQPQPDYLEALLMTIMQIHLGPYEGDILAFFTGQEEIELTRQLLMEKAELLQQMSSNEVQLVKPVTPGQFVFDPRRVPSLLICTLYAALPSDSQMNAFAPTPAGSRKVILSTNIAETSVTIPNIKFVIDPGVAKVRQFQAATGFDSLIVQPISQAEANQRAGRAGRDSPGTCYRLYTEDAYEQLRPNIVPEIQRVNLASVLLQLKALNVDNLMQFDFLSPPSKGALKLSLEQLLALQTLDPNTGKLNELGRLMVDFPLTPFFARALIISSTSHYTCSEELLSIIAMLSVEALYSTAKSSSTVGDAGGSVTNAANMAKKRFQSSTGDHITLLTLYTHYTRAPNPTSYCRENHLNQRAMAKVDLIRQQLREICVKKNIPLNSVKQEIAANEEDDKDNDGNNNINGSSDAVRSASVFSEEGLERIRKALLSGFFLNVARKSADSSYTTLLESQTVYIHPSSVLFHVKPDWLLYNELVVTTKKYMRDLTAIDREWLQITAPHFWNENKPGAMQSGGAKTASGTAGANGVRVSASTSTGAASGGAGRFHLNAHEIDRIARIEGTEGQGIELTKAQLASSKAAAAARTDDNFFATPAPAPAEAAPTADGRPPKKRTVNNDIYSPNYRFPGRK